MKRPATTFAASSLLGAALAFGALTGPAAAGDTALLSEDASSCEIFRNISRVIPSRCAENPFGNVRSIRLRGKPESAAAADVTPIAADAISAADAIPADAVPAADIVPTTEVAAVEQTSVAPGQELSVAMPIRFAYNSDVLADDAKETLDRVAEVLNDQLMQDKVILVEGHADAVGSDDYNLELSLRRAQAVQTYLVYTHQISAERLPFLGKG